MKTLAVKFICIVFLFFSFYLSLRGNDTLQITISANYYTDLSDTYNGGSLFSNDLTFTKSWYGINICYGYFQSQSKFLLKVPVSEINAILKIPIDEMSIMKVATLSGVILPIQTKLIETEVLVGLSYHDVKSFYLKGVDFSYDFNENKFSYFIKDYQLSKTKRIGYQIGLTITFKILKRFGLQLNSRIEDFRKSGSFFFVGGGLRINIKK